MSTRISHYSGEKHYRLTLIERVGADKWKRPTWKMICECGTEIMGNLKDRKSCGCLQRDITVLNNAKKRHTSGEANFNRLYGAYKRSAYKRGFSFELSKEQFRILSNGNCYYCERMPSSEGQFNKLSFGTFLYNGIDRVDNNLGYQVENCVSCCSTCNLGKRKLSPQAFYNWASNVVKNMEQKHGYKISEKTSENILKSWRDK